MDYFYQGHKIGTLKDGIFRKRADITRHLMKKYDAWGIDFATLEKIKDECSEIRILETTSNTVYHVPFETIYKEGFVEDYGDGRQCFLPRDKWNTYELRPSQP